MFDAVYIHVPFCSHICNYCDFTKVLGTEEFVEGYFAALLKESEPFKNRRVSSVYLGGGTPSSLDYEHFEKLLSLGRDFLKPDGEYCVEINPESCDDDKIALLKRYGVNRVSIGAQTFNDSYLRRIGRRHTAAMTIDLVRRLQKNGFNNISVDLMFGFSFQKRSDLQRDLEEILRLNIQHISCYPLQIERHTVFYNEGEKALDDDELFEMYQIINKKLQEKGYKRYEISNFSLEGFVSRHNLVYWKDEEYLGLGPGASGYVDGVRYENTKSLPRYINGVTKVHRRKIEGAEEEFEYIMLNLRLREGINFSAYERRFHKVFLEVFAQKVTMLMERGFVNYDDNRLYLTDKGVYLENLVVVELTSDLNYGKERDNEG